MLLRLKLKLKLIAQKLIAARVSPHQIALGVSVGVFVGIFPTFGFGAVFILFAASVAQYNIPAALIASLVGNPFFAPLWISLSCLISGIDVSSIKMPEETLVNILGHYSEILLRYVVGNSIVSIIFAVVSYFAALGLVTWYRNRKTEK